MYEKANSIVLLMIFKSCIQHNFPHILEKHNIPQSLHPLVHDGIAIVWHSLRGHPGQPCAEGSVHSARGIKQQEKIT